MEVKIQIPDNCELIKDGDTYIVKEKNDKPRSWEEFCRKYPVKGGEAFIDIYGWIGVRNTDCEDNLRASKNWCVSKEEAEAFLALMQLRQLRKAWVGDWEQPNSNPVAGIFYSPSKEKLIVFYGVSKALITLSFPSTKMAEDFLNCFKDLSETAKILL